MSEHSASPARRRSSISDAPSTADEAIAQLEQYAALVARLESENSVLTAQRDRARAEGESLREQAMAQVKGLQKSARAKDEALKKLRAELKSAAAVTAERVAAQDARSAQAEATRADLARALARVQELEDRQKLQARAYRKQRAELLRLRDIAEKDIETAESQANILAEAEARAYTAEQNRLDEVARAHAELEELQASARADIERARAEAEDQQTEMDRVRKELASTKAALQHITEEHTRAQVAMEKERRGRHELVSKVQHDASAQHKKLARRVTKLSAELAACNESLSMEKQGAARANAEMLKLLASVEAAETKLKAEVAARAAEAKEHLKVVAQLESEHCEHAENLRRLSENREAALLSQHEYEQRQLGTLSPQKALSTSSSPPNLTNDRTQLVLVNAERQQGTDALSLDEVAPKSLKDPRQLHLESVLDAVQAEVSMLKTSNERKEKELETVRRQHEMQMRNVREKTEMRIGNLLQRLEERHKKSLAENVPVEGEERKGESTTSCASTKPTVANGSRVSAMTLETTTAAAKAGAPSSSSSSSTTTIMSKDYADELREKYRQTLHELSVSRAGAERLMAERASFSSQVASMDAQLKAMHDLVKQLERARDAASTQHENERKLLEKQVVRLVQGVRKCKAQLMKRRDQVARLKSNFIKFRDSMTRQGGARAAHIYNHSSLLLLANGGGLMYQTPPGTPSRKALPQRDGNGGRALPYSPSGLFYNPMTLQLSTPNNEHAGGNVGRRRYRSGTPLIASSIQGGKDLGGHNRLFIPLPRCASANLQFSTTASTIWRASLSSMECPHPGTSTTLRQFSPPRQRAVCKPASIGMNLSSIPCTTIAGTRQPFSAVSLPLPSCHAMLAICLPNALPRDSGESHLFCNSRRPRANARRFFSPPFHVALSALGF